MDGAERWKLSLHLNCSNIVCANLAQAEHIYVGLEDMVKRDPEWCKKIAYYESQDKKGKTERCCIYDPSVYKRNQLMRLPMAWKKTGNKEKDGPPFQPFLTFKGEPFAFDRESFLASCLTSVDIKKAHKVPIDKFPNQRQRQRREKQPQKRIAEQKQLDRMPELKQYEEKKSATMMDFCYRILQDQFPSGGDRTSIVKEKHRNRFYVIQNSGGRPCYFGPHHQSNNGFFVMCR